MILPPLVFPGATLNANELDDERLKSQIRSGCHQPLKNEIFFRFALKKFKRCNFPVVQKL
jgi:hypothetical protein